MSMVIVAMVAVAAFATAGWMKNAKMGQVQSQLKLTAAMIQNRMSGLIENDKIWSGVVNHGNNSSTFACRLAGGNCSGATGPFTFADLDGTLYTNHKSATAGLDIFGEPCDSFKDSGSDLCPFRYELTWTAECKPAEIDPNCSNPYDHVVGVLKFKPSSTSLVLNTDTYKIDLVRGKLAGSLQSACSAMNGEFDQETKKCKLPSSFGSTCSDVQTMRGAQAAGTKICQDLPALGSDCGFRQGMTGFSSAGVFLCGSY